MELSICIIMRGIKCNNVKFGSKVLYRRLFKFEVGKNNLWLLFLRLEVFKISYLEVILTLIM